MCLDKKYLYDSLVAWLGDDIGIYRNGSREVKAIAFLPMENFGYDYPPDDWRTIGIEIVVLATMPKHSGLLNHQAIEEEIWELFIKNWEEDINAPKGDLKLIEMGKTLAQNLASNGILFKNSDVIQGNEALNMRPQIKFILRQPGSIGLL
ncbi:MAG: hypothetical protein QNJ54_01505 [Prochloraceae cyanobacterium]|nr:hypothetical protein [Prochloraceae cyanobacterium]